MGKNSHAPSWIVFPAWKPPTTPWTSDLDVQRQKKKGACGLVTMASEWGKSVARASRYLESFWQNAIMFISWLGYAVWWRIRELGFNILAKFDKIQLFDLVSNNGHNFSKSRFYFSKIVWFTTSFSMQWTSYQEKIMQMFWVNNQMV